MGSITYDDVVVEFDDRTLAHLQVVVVQHYRAGRPLLLSWLDALRSGDGRSSVWLTPSAPLHFKFAGSRAPSISQRWIESLTERADSGAGLVVVDEDGQLVRAMNQYRLGSSRPV